MTRWLCLAILGLSISACSSDDERYEHDHRPPRAPACSEALSCGSCTPILGCGWCQYDDGSGRCATSPKACGDNFRWNWEPEACPASPPTDAGVDDAPGPTDAAPSDAPESDASPSDAPESDAGEVDAASDAAEGDAKTCSASVPTGCVQSFGGTLCGAGQYTLGCTKETPRPDACTAMLVEPSTIHYCCKCK